MKLLGKTAIRSLLALSLLAPTITFAAPIVYDISTASSGGFDFSFLNGASNSVFADANDGYWLAGETDGSDEVSISGSLSIDWDTPSATTGSITAVGNFGQGPETWTLDITGGSTSGAGMFEGGLVDLLLSLDYALTGDSSGLLDEGTFYFADRSFGGGAANSGSAGASEIYLLGNNWVNEFGSGDKDLAGEVTMAIGIYGVSSVPEPASLFMLGTGLLGLALRRRRKAA